MGAGNKPVYKLFITNKSNTKNKTYAGVAFDNGGILNIVLNPGVVIDDALIERCWVSLVPYEDSGYYVQREGVLKPPQTGEDKDGKKGPDDDSDLPF